MDVAFVSAWYDIKTRLRLPSAATTVTPTKKVEYYGGPTYYMECGLGEERHWGKLWLIPALIFGIGIFSTFLRNLFQPDRISGRSRCVRY